jgi:hypothetical protein
MYTTLQPQSVDSQVEQAASEEYLINTEHILQMHDESDLPTVITRITYKFNVYEDQTTGWVFDATNTLAAIKALADTSAASTKIAIDVFEDIQTFDKIPGQTAVTWYFNVSDIVWAEDSPSGAYARLWYLSGGHKVTPVIVDHNIAKIFDLADTGTTTTTTSSTTTTSA